MFGADAEFGPRSRAAVGACLATGSLIACDIVWAEIAAAFPSAERAAEAMHRVGVRFSPLGVEASLAAGAAWRAYRAAGGTRSRLVADFLIAAHATAEAERLLTRDRGFYRQHFATLELVDPGAT